MAVSITSLTGNGLRDWLIQRVTAVIIGCYFLFFVGYFLVNPHIDFTMWQALFHNMWMQIFTLLFLVSLVLHAWIGIWTVLTDYIKCAALRLSLEIIIFLALVAFLFWGVKIIWGF